MNSFADISSTPTIQHYAVPTTLEEATQLLAEENATVFAGGTDIMPQMQSGARAFQPLLVNLNRLAELKAITKTNGSISIGALTTITNILRSAVIEAMAPVLQDTADCFASGQIRNAATIGGNICNASPAGDMIIPLLLLDAEVELASGKNETVTTRRIPLHEFFTGPGRTKMERNELLTFIHFPIPAEGFIARFKKFGTRPALDISVVSIGVAGYKKNGALSNTRVAFGAVAPIPLRGKNTEVSIESKDLNEETISKAALVASNEIQPIDDVRASAWYRREITRTFTERILHDLNKS